MLSTARKDSYFMEIAQVARDEYFNLARRTLRARRSSVELSQRNNLERGESDG